MNHNSLQIPDRAKTSVVLEMCPISYVRDHGSEKMVRTTDQKWFRQTFNLAFQFNHQTEREIRISFIALINFVKFESVLRFEFLGRPAR